MEHIVQFAIGIDDEAIKSELTEYAKQRLYKDLEAQVKECLYGKYYGSKEPLKNILINILKDIVYSNKDYIITEAIKSVTKSICRSKVCKESLETLNKE